MSLLKDIIHEATAPKTDVPRLLRLCLILAFKLKHSPFRTWIHNELEGYPEGEPLPSYRIVKGRSRGLFVGRVQGVIDLPMRLLPQEVRPRYESVQLRDSISEYANLVEKSNRDDNDNSLRMMWPLDIAVKYASKLVVDGQCVEAWIEFSESEMAAIVDKVTTKVLNFALEIEAEAPDAGEIESTSQPVMKEERVKQIFNTTIQGNVQNYSAGGSHFKQIAVESVHQGDLESLILFLRSLGLAEDDLDRLKEAIKTDQKQSPSTGMGESIKGWVGDMLIKATQGVIGIAPDVISGVIVQAITMFLGPMT